MVFPKQNQLNNEVFTKLGQITDSFKECFVSGYNNIFTDITGHGNWDWVTEDHSESLLINTVLTSRFSNFFLSVAVFNLLIISFEGVFKCIMWYKARSDLMNVSSLKSLLLKGFR